MITFKMFETPIGNLPAQTFRATEAEKLVLLNIDDMIAQGRHVTQQDAINVPQEKMDEEELNKEQLESAYKQLIQIRLIQVEPDQTVVISPEGAPIVEELKKAEQQEAEQEPEEPQQPQGDTGMGGDMGGGAMPGAELGGMQGGAGPMEGIELIRYLNEMSKLLEDSALNVFTIYKVESGNTSEVYYGFCQGTGEKAMRDSFMSNEAGNGGRGVVKLLKANGGPEGLEFEAVDQVDDEEKALLRRNEFREEDVNSITKVSYFPGTLNASVKTKHPDLYAQHKKRLQGVRDTRKASIAHEKAKLAAEVRNKTRTAAQVYNSDGFAEEDVEQAMEKFGRKQVLDDLYGMSAIEFSKRYGIQFRT